MQLTYSLLTALLGLSAARAGQADSIANGGDEVRGYESYDDGYWYPGKYEGNGIYDDGKWYPGKYEGNGKYDDGKWYPGKYGGHHRRDEYSYDDGSWWPGKYEGNGQYDDGKWYPGKYDGNDVYDDGSWWPGKYPDGSQYDDGSWWSGKYDESGYKGDDGKGKCPDRKDAIAFKRMRYPEGIGAASIIGYFFNWQICDSVVPLYAAYNPQSKDYFYTVDEQKKLKYISNKGYQDQGTAGFLFAEQTCGSVALYKFYDPKGCQHFYTTSWEEKEKAIKCGYEDKGIEGYIYQW